MYKFTFRVITLAFGFLFLLACSKTEIPATIIPVPIIQEDAIKFTVSPDISSGTINLSTDSIAFTVNVSSKLPSAGIIYSIEVKRVDTAITTYKIDSISSQSSLLLKVPGFTIKANYNIKITVTSKSSTTNTSNQSVQINRSRVYKNYLKTSYELYNSTKWFSSDSLFSNGSKYLLDNPLMVPQTAQIDIDGDGIEDLLTFDSYSLSIIPTPNPPPSIFKNNGKLFNKINWAGPSIRDPHATKILLGDFNNDSLPDIFSLVAVDPPGGGFPTLTDNCHLIYNSLSGFNKVLEFDDKGFWYSGCSGDIDKDGDLDIIMFNFHYLSNGVKSKILWNDGKGNFTSDVNGIGDLAIVSGAELIDINHDGFLDLVINKTRPMYTPCPCTYIVDLVIMWGNGKDFNINNSTSFINPTGFLVDNIHATDLDGDGIDEIILAGYDGMNTKFWLELYKSDDKGKTFVNKTIQYFDNNISTKRFDAMRMQDIDNNGRIDIFAPDKKDNIRWEWNGSKFIKF